EATRAILPCVFARRSTWRTRAIVRIIVFVVLGAAVGCDCNSGTIGDTGTGGGSAGGGSTASTVSISVTPADQVATLTLGAKQTVAYQAMATFANHAMGPVEGRFSLSGDDLGVIDPVSGLFAANGGMVESCRSCSWRPAGDWGRHH